MKLCEISVFYFLLKRKVNIDRLEMLHLLPNEALDVGLLDILLLWNAADDIIIPQKQQQ